MATRFYFETTTAPNISPAFDAGWEQTGQAVRRVLTEKMVTSVISPLADSTAITVPITTTQDILAYQFVSSSIPPQALIGTVSSVIRVLASATTENATLAFVIKVVSSDGGTVVGTPFSTFSTGATFVATAATRILSASNLTTIITQPGNRLVVEVGAHVAAPSTAGTYTMRFGYSAASDFALTSALTTDLNPWIEFSQPIWPSDLNNYQFPKVGTGMSTGERIK